MTGQLSNRTALITGAAQGLGAAIAEAMAEEGARVILGDIDGDAVHAQAAALTAMGHDAAGYVHDVADEASWRAIVDACDHLDILVNNAGVLMMQPIADTSLADFRRVAAVNTDGVFLGIRAAFAKMGPRGGTIINISSIAGMEGAANHIAYCASKGAVRLMTKSAAIEAAALDHPIRVNSIHPGGIDTRMTQTTYRFGQGLGIEEAVSASIPCGRVGLPGDIAGAAVFLASDAAAYINGTELVVDGGMLAGRFRRRRQHPEGQAE